MQVWCSGQLEDLVLSRKCSLHDKGQIQSAYSMVQKYKILDGSLVTEEDVLNLASRDKMNMNIRKIKRKLLSLNKCHSLYIDESQFTVILQTIKEVRDYSIQECSQLMEKLTVTNEAIENEHLNKAFMEMCHLNIFDSHGLNASELVEVLCYGKDASMQKEIKDMIKSLDDEEQEDR